MVAGMPGQQGVGALRDRCAPPRPGERRRAGTHARCARAGTGLRCRRAGRGAGEVRHGGSGGGERLVAGPAPAPRGGRVRPAALLRPGGGRPRGPDGAVSARVTGGPRAPRGDDGPGRMVLVVRAVRPGDRGRHGRQPRVLRRELRPPLLPPDPARRRLSESHRGLGHESQVPARAPLAHRSHPRAVVSGRPVDRAVRGDRPLRHPGRAPRVAAQERRRPDRLGHPRRLGRQGLLARRGASRGAGVAARVGAPHRARLGLRLREDRLPAVGHRGHRALRRTHPRRGLPGGPRGDPRRARPRGVPVGLWRPAAARRRLRERHAHRDRRGRKLGRPRGPGARGCVAELLPPRRVAQRPRLSRRAAAAHRAPSADLGGDRGGLGRRQHALRQPPQAARGTPAAAATHAARGPRHGPPRGHSRDRARAGAGDRGR